MTAADIYLSAMNGWKPEQEQERSSEKERERGTVVDFLEARKRLRDAQEIQVAGP